MPCGPTCAFVPVVVDMAWPVLSSAIASALANLGYEAVAAAQEMTVEGASTVEVDVPRSQGFEESLGEEETLTLKKEGVTLCFRKGADGRLKVAASSAGVEGEELKKQAEAAVHAFLQAYVRERVTAELRRQGFSLREERLPDGSVRLLAKKWG